MTTGTVKWFNAEKGFGFITVDADESAHADGNSSAGAPQDVFVHYRSIDMPGFRTLNEGARVEFEITAGEKGPQAEKVRLAD